MDSKMYMVLVALCIVHFSGAWIDSAGEFPNKECPTCNEEVCPKTAEECSGRELVPDICGCCPEGVCGLGEGEKCFNATLSKILPPGSRKLGSCSSNMACILRPDLTQRDEPEALCVCKEPEVACGSDNRTYDSVCQMTQESSRIGRSVYLKHLGPCHSVPWVTSGPEDESGKLHQPLALDCEAKGYPIPSIQWEFKAHDGTTRVLPSDDQYIAIQVRGGPESFMVTSWVQIVDLRQTDTGTYTCVASNSEGSARASARVGIRG